MVDQPVLKSKDIVQKLRELLSETEAEKVMIEDRAKVQRQVAAEAKRSYDRDAGEEIIQMANSKISSLRTEQSLQKVMQAEDLLAALDKEVFSKQMKIDQLRMNLYKIESQLNNEKIKFIYNFNNAQILSKTKDSAPKSIRSSESMAKESSVNDLQALNKANGNNGTVYSGSRPIRNLIPIPDSKFTNPYGGTERGQIILTNRFKSPNNPVKMLKRLLSELRDKAVRDSNSNRVAIKGDIKNMYALHNLLNVLPKNATKLDAKGEEDLKKNNMFNFMLMNKIANDRNYTSGPTQPSSDRLKNLSDDSRRLGVVWKDIAIIHDNLNIRNLLKNLNDLNHVLVKNI